MEIIIVNSLMAAEPKKLSIHARSKSCIVLRADDGQHLVEMPLTTTELCNMIKVFENIPSVKNRLAGL